MSHRPTPTSGASPPEDERYPESMSAAGSLARPGNRRALDRWWLERLLRDGAKIAGEQAATPPTELMTGVAQFNAGEFYESHETWEWLWRGTDYPLRLFFLSLTKLGAGFTHAQRGNPTGMRRLLTDGLRYLEPFLPSMMGLDTSRLDSEVRQWLKQEPSSSPRPLPRIERTPAQH